MSIFFGSLGNNSKTGASWTLGSAKKKQSRLSRVSREAKKSSTLSCAFMQGANLNEIWGCLLLGLWAELYSEESQSLVPLHNFLLPFRRRDFPAREMAPSHQLKSAFLLLFLERLVRTSERANEQCSRPSYLFHSPEQPHFPLYWLAIHRTTCVAKLKCSKWDGLQALQALSFYHDPP